MPSAKAKAIFEADDKSILSALDRIGHKIEKVEHRFLEFNENIHRALEIAGIVIAIEKGTEAFKEFFENAERLQNISAQTGLAVGDLYSLEKMFKKVGGSAEDAAEAVLFMQKALATGASGRTLAQLGLNPEHLKNAAPTEAFMEAGAAIGKIENAVDRTNAAFETFGKKGKEVVAIFRSGHAEEIFENAKMQADIYQRNAGVFAEVNEKMGAIPGKLQSGWLVLADRMAASLLPLLDQITGKIEEWNRLGKTSGAGDAMSFFMDKLADPEGDMLAEVFHMLVAGADKALSDMTGTEPGSIHQSFQQKIDEWMPKHEAMLEEARRHHPAGNTDTGGSTMDFGAGAAPNVSALQRVGGNFGGNNGVDSATLLLDETRGIRTTLDRIEENTRPAKGEQHASAPAHGSYPD